MASSRLKGSRKQQAEGVDATRTQPAGRGTDQKRARACTKESPYVFEPEMPRWIAQELREKRPRIVPAAAVPQRRLGCPSQALTVRRSVSTRSRSGSSLSLARAFAPLSLPFACATRLR